MIAIEDKKKALIQDDSQVEMATLRRARKSFPFFYNTIFKISVETIDGEFIPSEWQTEFAGRLQAHQKTSTLAARKHGKTTVFMAYLAWLIFKGDIEHRMISEYLYIMYSDDLACEKIKRTKQYISACPYMQHCRDLKPTAESIIEYENNGHLISIKPAGVFSFKRGKHPDGVICDDILRDPQKKLDIEQIAKVTQVFEAEITALAKEGGFTHVAGTSQDETDIMFKLEKLPGWDTARYPAIIDRAKRIALWPEQFPFNRLEDIELNETGKKNFQREYQLIPVRTTEGFFSRGEIEALIDKQLKNYPYNKREADGEFQETFAGMDIGKKRHPSHIAVFEAITPEPEKKEEKGNKDKDKPAEEPETQQTYLVQIASIWLDGMDYNDQLAIYKQVVRRFGIQAMPWDNTRGELEGFMERGELPDEMQPFVMTAGGQEKLASDFDIQVGRQTIILLDDDRQTRSLLSVDGNLKSPETSDGHGDAFWSIGLAIQAAINNSMKQFI